VGKAKPAAVIETLADLTPDPRNARRHNPRNVGMLEKALGEVGAARSIVIDENGVVLAGNATIEAAGRAGIERVQVVDADGETIIAVRRTGLTAAQKTRLALYDNRTAELADWDADVIADLMANERAMLDGLFENDELAELIDDLGEPDTTDAEPQIDRAAELNKKWQVQAGDLWRIGDHRLLCGDSTKREDVERVMGGEKADIVFIDPPYMTFGSSTGKLEPQDFNMLAPFWDIVVENAQKNLKDGAPAFICCDWRSYPALSNAAYKHMSVKNLIVWDLGGALKLGMGTFRSSYELIVYCVNGKFGRNWSDKTGTWKVEDRSERDLWTIPQKEAAPGKNREHVSQKPVELILRAIKNGCVQDGILFDYFAGSGTTMVACENLKRKCRGIEISPDYCAVILERMATAFPALAIERA